MELVCKEEMILKTMLKTKTKKHCWLLPSWMRRRWENHGNNEDVLRKETGILSSWMFAEVSPIRRSVCIPICWGRKGTQNWVPDLSLGTTIHKQEALEEKLHLQHLKMRISQAVRCQERWRAWAILLGLCPK